MARKRTRAVRDTSSRAADDFTRIDGIGPITMKRLHGAGIRTFAQLAALSAEGLASLITNSSAKQITKQSWIQQAREQASSKLSIKTHEREPVLPLSRQHYENFTIEFLLDEKNKVRRLQIVHIQSGDVDTWTKWDAERLIDFLARHTGARLPYTKGIVLAPPKPKPTLKPSMVTKQASAVATATGSIPAADKAEEKIDSTSSLVIAESTSPALAPTVPPPEGEAFKPVPASIVPASTINRIRLLEWKTLLSSTKQILHNLSHDQCFDVNLSLDLTNASLPDTSQLEVIASLHAKKLGDGTRQVIGETRNTVPYASLVNLTIEQAALPQGLYRLEAFLTLVPNDSSLPTGSGINASFQGGLFQVY